MFSYFSSGGGRNGIRLMKLHLRVCSHFGLISNQFYCDYSFSIHWSHPVIRNVKIQTLCTKQAEKGSQSASRWTVTQIDGSINVKISKQTEIGYDVKSCNPKNARMLSYTRFFLFLFFFLSTYCAFQTVYITLQRALGSKNSHDSHIEMSFQTEVLKAVHLEEPFRMKDFEGYMIFCWGSCLVSNWMRSIQKSSSLCLNPIEAFTPEGKPP